MAREDLPPEHGHNSKNWADVRLLEHIEYVPIDVPRPYPGTPRKHRKRAQKKLDSSVKAFGIVLPILLDAEGVIVAGEALIESARRLGHTMVPVVRIGHLSSSEIRALRIALNRIVELGEWDSEKLILEFRDLIDLDYDVEQTAFDMGEIDLLFEQEVGIENPNPVDDVPPLSAETVSRIGDLWLLDEHRVLCGDARDPAAYEMLLRDERAQMAITDVPFNLKIKGNVCGKGSVTHDEFILASGELTDAEFEALQIAYVRNLVWFTVDGSVHYHFIDWRHINGLEWVCRQFYAQHLNTCVWAKSNAGMGSFYRSQHELILVMKNGTAPHCNNIELGRFGRHRSNVWHYDGCSTGTSERRADLELHPTTKPLKLIADAIRDASKRGGLILDPFLGSGTTIIACEMTHRVGAGMELDARYVDVIVRRWQASTGGEAVHAETGLTFAQMREKRLGEKLLLLAPATGEEA